MACNTLKLISPEAANAAYADGIRKARRLHELAKATRKIADALGGKYITKRLESTLCELFPGVRVYLIKSDYSPRKTIRLHIPGDYCTANDWDIWLHNGEDNRVNADAMREDAAHDDAKAAKIEDQLTRLYANICQYNALATAYAGMYDALHELIPDMVYSDSSIKR